MRGNRAGQDTAASIVGAGHPRYHVARRDTLETQSPVFTPARIGTLVLRHRLIRAGCYEGLARDGNVTEELLEHHFQLARGGITMTTLGYCAVSADGRGFAHELWMRD